MVLAPTLPGHPVVDRVLGTASRETPGEAAGTAGFEGRVPGDPRTATDVGDSAGPAGAGEAGSVSARTLVTELHRALDQAAGVHVESDPAEQGALVAELARAESRVQALRLRVLDAAERDSTALRAGVAGTDQWYADRTRTDRRQAARDTGLAKDLRDRPTTKDALADGAISPEHARVITRALQQLPGSVSAADRARIERQLVTQAKSLSPGRLRRTARRALAEAEPDEEQVDADEDDQLRAEEQRAREQVRLVMWDNGDGTHSGRFTLPELHAHLLQKILQTMTAPRRQERATRDGHARTSGRTQSRDDSAAGENRGKRDGGRPTGDPPTAHGSGDTDWAVARGEAFCELLEHLPTDHLAGKNAATVVVRIDQEILEGTLRAAGVDTGGTISSGEARRLACQAGLLPAVLGGASQPLDLGRTRRLFTEAQRTAVGLKHQHCAADGCERPFSWCELHHRTPWSAGGKTDVAEAVPLCHFHHQRIHDPTFRHREHPGGTLTFAPAVGRADVAGRSERDPSARTPP